MTSPGGKEVGRVSIRVVPDTHKFRDDLKRQLQGIKDIDLPTQPESDEFKQRLAELVKRAERDHKIDIPVDIDKNGLNKVSKSLQRALDVTNMPDFLNEMSRFDLIMRSVVANAMRIRQSLERASKSTRDMTRAALNIKGHFEGISHVVRTLPGYIGLLRFGPIEQGIRRTAIAVRDLGTNARATFATLGRGARTAGRALSRGIGGIFRGFGSFITSIGRAMPDFLGNSLQAAGGALKELGTNFKDLGTIGRSAFKAIGNAAVNVVSVVATLGASIVQMGAVATALVVAGGAIAVAWGAAATAIAALPAAIALIGVPLGLLLLDFDTLKSKIGELSPAFQQFRKETAEALASGLAPALETLANNVLPKVKQHVTGIAQSMGQMALETANFLSKGEGLKLLDGVLANVKRSIDQMKPGLRDLGISFLQLANNSHAFDALTGAINTFGAEFRRMVTELSQGDISTLDRAFDGLRMVLESASRAFVGFVRNGIELFVGAAPRASQALDSLTRFFDRFDWQKIGADIGGMFQGIGEALDKVPQSTIDGIAEAFGRLTQKFQDPAIQQLIVDLIGSIPTLVDWLGILIEGFLRAAVAITGLGSIFSGAGRIITSFAVGVGRTILGFLQSLEVVGSSIMHPIDAINGKFGPALEEARNNLVNGFEGFGAAFEQGKGEIERGVSLLGDAFTSSMPNFASKVNGIPDQILQPLMGIPGAINTKASPAIKQAVESLGGRSANAAERAMAQIPQGIDRALQPVPQSVTQNFGRAATEGPAALEPLPGAVSSITGQLPGVVKEGLSPVPDEAIGIFQQLEPGVRRAFAGLSIVAFEGMGYIRESVQDGLGQVRDYLNAQLGTQLAEPFKTAFTDVKTAVETEMTGISTKIQTSVTDIMKQFTSLTTSMSGVGIAFTNLGTQLVTLGVDFVNFNTNVTTLIASFSKFNTGLLTINTSLTNTNTTATTLNTSLTTLNTSLTTLGTNLTTLNTNVTDLNTSATTLNKTLTTLGTTLVNLGTGFSGLNLSLPTLNTSLFTLNTRFVTLNTTITAFNKTFAVFGQALNAIQSPITNLNTALTNLNTAFTNLQTTVQNAMTTIQDTVTTALQNIETAFTQGFDRIVQSVEESMRRVTEAIQRGMDDAVRAVEEGIDRMVSALEGAVSQFYDAGANMGQALADGLNSKAGAVEAAARRLADAAAAAMRAAAQIRSPSRVTWEIGEYIGLGLAGGMDESRYEVRKSARGLVNEVVSASDSIAKAFSIDAWTSDLTDGIPSAVRQYSAYSGVVDHNVSGEVTGIANAVETALSGWSVEIDSNGIAKMVNKSNTRRNRRR